MAGHQTATRLFGRATLAPGAPVVAGSFGTWTLTYEVGHHGVDDLGTILIARRLASDWGRPQFDRPADADYTTVATDGQAVLKAWFDPTAYIRPWKAALVIRVTDGFLRPGERVVVTFGDRGGGGPGSQVQSFVERSFEFHVAVDAFGTGQFVPVPDSPTVAVIGGPAVRLRAVAPSQVASGQPFAITVKAEDQWGNAASGTAGELTIACDDPGATLPVGAAFQADGPGAVRVEGLVLRQFGVYQLRLRLGDDGNSYETNPVVCSPPGPPYHVFWGDPHGQTEMAVGTGSLAEYIAYGRDVAGLDFLSHCANDFQITAADWAETRALMRAAHEPGRFITFLAYEWSGNTGAGGDHNVYFLGDDEEIHRSSHWQIADRTDEASDRYPVSRVHETYRGRDDVLVLPHIGGRRADLTWHDPAIGPAIEIMSVHGLFWWFAEEALRLGHRVAFIAGSDDHSGRPGSTFPSSSDIHFGLRGGLTAVQASALTREGIWEAIRARRCYGTTGERMILELTADGYGMGSEFRATEPPRLFGSVIATAPLDRVEVWRGTTCVHRHPLGTAEPGRRLQVVWSGARVPGRNRETRWDGELTLSTGRITGVTEFAFDSPREGVTAQEERRVAWRSTTCGDPDGLFLDLADAAEAELDFRAGPARFRLRLADLGAEPHVVEAGGLEQRVELTWAPVAAGPRVVDFFWRDEQIQAGTNAYYLRVRQLDGAIGWTSPIYVDFAV